MRILLYAALAVVFLGGGASAEPPSQPVGSFSTAKKIARDKVYAGRHTTFYCGCAFTPSGTSGGVIDPTQCGYQVSHDATRGGRLEWEHVMPASRIGGHRDCWKRRENFPACFKSNGKLRSGRDCCLKVDAGFKLAHNDLHNLTPAVGELNGDRSDHPYGIVEDEPRDYGSCDFEIGESPKVAEPAEAIRGDIARIWLYMSETHGVALTLEERGLMERWSQADLIDAQERERDQRIKDEQGNHNPHVKP